MVQPKESSTSHCSGVKLKNFDETFARQWFHPLYGGLYHARYFPPYNDFCSIRRVLQNVHCFDNVFIQWHGSGVISPLPLQLCLHPGGDDLDNLDRRVPDLEPKRLRIGVQRRFRRTVGWNRGARHERQGGGDVQDGRSWLRHQGWKQRGCQPDRH